MYASPQTTEDLPIDLIDLEKRAKVLSILGNYDFKFKTITVPKPVKINSMEILFDNPRLSAAMWRQCEFSPSFFAFEESPTSFSIDDTQGLKAKLRLLYRVPGHRIYLVEGVAESGRLNSFSPLIRAQMLTSYRYRVTPSGFETELTTWTKLDSQLLGYLSKPFHRYVQGRQDEFIAYINNNIASFGASTEVNILEFRNSKSISEDPVSSRVFNKLYLGK